MANSKRICAVAGCGKSVEARGWCSMHYHRWRKHGDPTAGRTPNGEALAFIESASQHQGDDCLIWPFAVGQDGYGRVWLDGKLFLAHRVVCARAHGEAPTDSHEAAHDFGGMACISRACVNPDHLRWTTRIENEADKILHGRTTRGSRNGFAKLTEGEVVRIYSLRGIMAPDEIAAMFDVSTWTIESIHQRTNWAWLTSQYEAT